MPKKSYVKKRRYQLDMKRQAQQGRINTNQGQFVGTGSASGTLWGSSTGHYINGHRVNR